MAAKFPPFIPTLNVNSLGSDEGALYLGAIGAAILYGATIVQIYFYVRKYGEDRKLLKAAVAFLWLMDTAHMAVIIAGPWHYLIDSFGNYYALVIVTWSHKAQQLTNVIIILTVQSLYAWRVWKLSSQRNRVWPWVVSVILMCGYATGIVLLVKTYQLQLFTELIHIRSIIISAFVVTTFNDLVLAAGICHLIYLSTPTLGMHRRTKSMLLVVIRYVLISGMLTSVCTLAGLICFCIMPGNAIALAIMFVATKLYINSYLAMLNARKSIRNCASAVQKTMEMSSLEIRVSTYRSTRDGGEVAGERIMNTLPRETSLEQMPIGIK
ncbi:hypothetical protein F5887DRAFT_56544 [Amanita rubescens]|nr:hypothetical protein F5887DRAFT_56544 [Amanita rubescens]